MAKRSNDTFLDKFLGLFGITRPKKRKTVSNRRQTSNKTSSNVNQAKHGNLSVNDDFLIVSSTSQTQNTQGSSKSAQNSNSLRKSSAKKGKNISSSSKKKSKPKNRKMKTALITLLVIVILFSTAFLAAFAWLNNGNYMLVDTDETTINLHDLKLEFTSVLYAKNEKGEYVEFDRLQSEQNRLWVDYEDVPEHLVEAYISCEDKTFRSHKGVNWKRTISATANLVFDFYETEQGGSTITQQLIKNITNDNDHDWKRKFREIKNAISLEHEYDKDTIMECYLNTIHLGNGVDGVEMAATYYFDKNASDLTLVQSACLAAITSNPSSNEPYNNPKTNKERRNWVLDEMYKNGFITKKECQEAKNADLELRKNPSISLSTSKASEDKYDSYFVDAVIDDVIKALVDENIFETSEEANKALRTGGYKIYTTIDLDMQDKLEEIYEDSSSTFGITTEDGKSPQSAMTIMDYQGNVKAIVGGLGEKNADRLLNRATSSPRPTGSSIKPLSVYGPAIEENVITWASVYEDSPVKSLAYGQAPPTSSWPKNSTGVYQYADVPIHYALQKSLNTVSVKILHDLTIDKSYSYATKKLGLSYFTKDDGNGNTDMCESSLALGGSVKGATTLQMAAAYCTFGNGGVYYEPRTFTKILDQNNKVIIDEKKNKHRAFSEDTAGVMCKLLQTVSDSQGTGAAAQFGDWEIMCKTGTTSDNKDKWFIGGTSKYMAACWFGGDNNKEMQGLTYEYLGQGGTSNPAIKMWKKVMEKVHEGLEPEEFDISSKTEFRKYCLSSHKCAMSGCSSTAYGYFKSSDVPFCTTHYGYRLDAITPPDYENYYDFVQETTTEETTKKKDKDKDKDNENTTESAGASDTTQTTPPSDVSQETATAPVTEATQSLAP